MNCELTPLEMDNFSDNKRESNLNTNSSVRSKSTKSSDSPSVTIPAGEYISENATILEEGLRVCPVCQSELRLFVLNDEEKLLMCESIECPYPFYEDNLPIYKNDSEFCSTSKYSRSKRTLDDTSATCSIASSSWSDIDRISKALDTDYNSSEYRLKNRKKITDEKEKVQKLMQNVDHVKNLTNEMKELNTIGRKRRITNNKYIKNLLSLQSMTGAKMLEPEELQIARKDTDIPQLKVNVNTDPENSVSCIKIELVDITNEEKKAAETSAV